MEVRVDQDQKQINGTGPMDVAVKPQLFDRYQQLQRYVGWEEADVVRIRSIAPLLEPALPALIDDFYEEIERHHETRHVITGGQAQVERLKGTLIRWLHELLSGVYDAAYVERRWRVGYRHVEIGLEQVFTNAALSRLRTGLKNVLRHAPGGADIDRFAAAMSLNKLLDLDLAIIEDAYQTEYALRQQRIERLAAIGQIAGGVAHEVRNPLNVIKTSVYYLLNARNPSAEKRAEHLARIEKQVGIADGVITALSNFAKMPLPARSPLAVSALVQEILDAVQLPSTIQVEIDLPASLPRVLADAGQLQIVLSNLIRNARDAMSNAGTLTVSARADANLVRVSIADTGHGIAAEDIKRIMEPFFTTKARGIGLGLAISNAILAKNEATLSVQSEFGQGSVFTISLEAAPPAETFR
jgi:signal transduction histidine kinase